MLQSAAVSALAQVLLLGGVPLFGYWIWQRRRYKRTFGETARRAGLQLGKPRYLVYSLLFAAASAAFLVIWPPPLEPLIRQGSMYRQFAGLGLGGQAIAMAFLYGVVQTGQDLAGRAAILDGEIVRPGPDGRPLFYELMRPLLSSLFRMHQARETDQVLRRHANDTAARAIQIRDQEE
jgi:hypothetical protein